MDEPKKITVPSTKSRVFVDRKSRTMKYDIFISYSRKDFDEVAELIGRLRAEIPNLALWFDATGIESGDDFDDKIIAAIENSSCLLFAVSDNAQESQWVRDEVMYARNIDKKVIPVLMKGAQMRGWFLFKFGRVDCIDSADEMQFKKLIQNLSAWTGKDMCKKTIPQKSVRHDIPESTEVPGLKVGVRVRVKGDGSEGVAKKVYLSSDGKEKCFVQFEDGRSLKKRVTSLEVL